jgi:hypothetical protein
MNDRFVRLEAKSGPKLIDCAGVITVLKKLQTPLIVDNVIILRRGRASDGRRSEY